MPRRSNIQIGSELQALGALIAEHPAGITRAALADAYQNAHHVRIPWRTLLRRLDTLASRGHVVPEGGGARRRYRPVATVAAPATTEGSEPPRTGSPLRLHAEPGRDAEPVIPLSPKGEEIRARVRRPEAARQPVGYDPAFLARYRPGKTWYLPADVRTRLHHLGRTPAADQPAGTYAREIFEHLLIDLSWASSRLEGNRYSRLDTKELLGYGREAEGKAAEETQMILNHKAAIELLVEHAGEVGFNRRTFLSLHAALAENLVNDRLNEGRLRTRLVGIGNSVFTPLAIPQQIEEEFDRLLETADHIPDPFEQAFFVMVHLPYLQPFIDVNKRTSRLGANLPLIRANLCPLSFVGLPETAYVEGLLGVYELTRVELLRDVFVWAYERSCRQYAVLREALGKPDPVRLTYREELRAVVREFVEQGTKPDPSTIHDWALAHAIPFADLPDFTEAARADLLDLHEMALWRYRLRTSTFAAWRDQLRTPVG